ncbi:hypothetical protein AUR64_02125 [Haloprofundus marisrubri]|uniref:Uncharacterized protein n=1 Tax=Haloprofundus marisrubri TaxID=1514971 RepID=A0A0W1R3B3_9EURY|nr:hypothetical protein [Haloprofundus marisrubri]KTG07801.1 hypothetical protein AUR64_02125 [Haloprofundus marisrubri]
MSAAHNTRQVADTELPGGGFSVPFGNGEQCHNGSGYRLTWHPARGRIKIAFFRVATDDRVALLQHIRTITISQRQASDCQLDDVVSLDDVPTELLALMKAAGYTPAEEVSAE